MLTAAGWGHTQRAAWGQHSPVPTSLPGGTQGGGWLSCVSALPALPQGRGQQPVSHMGEPLPSPGSSQPLTCPCFLDQQPPVPTLVQLGCSAHSHREQAGNAEHGGLCRPAAARSGRDPSCGAEAGGMEVAGGGSLLCVPKGESPGPVLSTDKHRWKRVWNVSRTVGSGPSSLLEVPATGGEPRTCDAGMRQQQPLHLQGADLVATTLDDVHGRAAPDPVPAILKHGRVTWGKGLWSPGRTFRGQHVSRGTRVVSTTSTVTCWAPARVASVSPHGDLCRDGVHVGHFRTGRQT